MQRGRKSGCAPVEMTNLFAGEILYLSWKHGFLPSNRIVISTGAQRSGEICGFFSCSHADSKGRTLQEVGFFLACKAPEGMQSVQPSTFRQRNDICYFRRTTLVS